MSKPNNAPTKVNDVATFDNLQQNLKRLSCGVDFDFSKIITLLGCGRINISNMYSTCRKNCNFAADKKPNISQSFNSTNFYEYDKK